MISITSEAGIRMAKAKAAYHDALARNDRDLLLYRDRFMTAACAVANELIAERFHEYTEQGDK